MLSKMDDMVFHQLPTTFDHPVSSDPRWFEHMYFLMTAKNGEIAVVTGNRTYLNIDVIEAFGAVVHNNRQYNVRASRRLRPDMDRSVGPLRTECVEGLKEFNLSLGKSGIPIEFEINWKASGPAWEEPHHFRRHNGRVAEDYMRFDQVGTFGGHVIVEGRRYELDHVSTFGARDHSWGIRTLIAGDDFAATMMNPGAGHWMLFDIEGIGQGYVASVEDLFGRTIKCSGHFGARYGVDLPPAGVSGLSHCLKFHDGSRLLKDGRIVLSLDDGRSLDIEVEAITRPLNEHGCGNQKGFADGLGYGIARGDFLVEGDVWDHTDPKVVKNLGPSATVPNNRLYDNVVRLRCGDHVGYAIYVLFIPREFEPYGFGP